MLIYRTSQVGQDIDRLRSMQSGEFDFYQLNEFTLAGFIEASLLASIRRTLGNIRLNTVQLVDY